MEFQSTVCGLDVVREASRDPSSRGFSRAGRGLVAPRQRRLGRVQGACALSQDEAAYLHEEDVHAAKGQSCMCVTSKQMGTLESGRESMGLGRGYVPLPHPSGYAHRNGPTKSVGEVHNRQHSTDTSPAHPTSAPTSPDGSCRVTTHSSAASH